MEHKSRVEMAVMNVQDFGDSKLQMMTRQCVMKGFGSGLSAIQAAFQTFAINLKKEAASRKGCPGRLMDDVSPGDAKVLEGIVDKMLIKKLSRPGKLRLAMWPSIPDALSLPTLTSSSSPIFSGNIGCYKATMVERSSVDQYGSLSVEGESFVQLHGRWSSRPTSRRILARRERSRQWPKRSGIGSAT